MTILTENAELSTESLTSEIIHIIKAAEDSIEAEKKLFSFGLTLLNTLVQGALEIIDKELYRNEYKDKGYRISRQDQRTIYCLWGELTYRRILLKAEGKKSFYPIDHKMGFDAGKHYSLAVIENIVKVMSTTTSRNTEKILQDLTRINVSHQTVVTLKNYAGQKAIAYEKAKAKKIATVKEIVSDGVLAIEGDGIVLKGKKGGNKEELHRIQIYTGVRKNGKRTMLEGRYCFTGMDQKELIIRVKEYLNNHYNLSELTILSNGDGGAGYQVTDFEQMVEGCKAHLHFRDRFHVNKKIRTRLSFCDKSLVERITRECNNLKITSECIIDQWMDTAASQAQTGKDEEEVERLRAYLKKNTQYMPTIKQRGIKTNIHLGTAETSHRSYSYRLKRQGRVWSHQGLENMAAVLTAQKNDELNKVLLYKANGTNYKKKDRAFNTATREAIKAIVPKRLTAAQKRKQRSYRPGCLGGRIGCHGASTSPMARLAHAIQF